MKTKITIIILLLLTKVLTAQDTSIVHYNLNAVDSAAVERSFWSYFECTELNKNTNLRYKKKDIKKDILIAQIIDWEFRTSKNMDLKEFYGRLLSVYNLEVGYGAVPPMDIYFRNSSFYIWIKGGYCTYFLGYKENDRKESGISIQLLSENLLPCSTQSGTTDLFDLFYFKKHIVPRLSKKIYVYYIFSDLKFYYLYE